MREPFIAVTSGSHRVSYEQWQGSRNRNELLLGRSKRKPQPYPQLWKNHLTYSREVSFGDIIGSKENKSDGMLMVKRSGIEMVKGIGKVRLEPQNN